MTKFYATVEFLSGQHAAILTLTDQAGEWAGSGRIEVRSGLTRDLYEEAYRHASFNAAAKGGRLERFSIEAPPPPDAPKPAPTFRERAEQCHERVGMDLPRRPANALNIEMMQPSVRCRLQTPDHWGSFDYRATRWLWSGGSPLVLGVCACSSCPQLQSV